MFKLALLLVLFKGDFSSGIIWLDFFFDKLESEVGNAV
jgi:hypothetical protein